MNLETLVPLVIEVGRAAWKLFADHDHNEDRAKAIARAAMDAAIEEARYQADLAGIKIAQDVLDAAQKKVLEAFDVKGTFPSLGIEVEVVKEITDEDRERERKQWDDLKTPPEGSQKP